MWRGSLATASKAGHIVSNFFMLRQPNHLTIPPGASPAYTKVPVGLARRNFSVGGHAFLLYLKRTKRTQNEREPEKRKLPCTKQIRQQLRQ